MENSATASNFIQPFRVSMAWALALSLATVSCSTPPRKAEDICSIFSEKHSWYRATRRTRTRWQIPEAVQMAVIYQESSYRARARPPRTRLLWVIPWRRPSSAYGYAQVVRPTWQTYLKDTDNRGANRDNFWDASDFVGWYLDRIARRHKLRRDDARSLYLAYHEGSGGFKRGTHLKKGWLLSVSDKVQRRAQRYESQIQVCREQLERHRWWWPF